MQLTTSNVRNWLRSRGDEVTAYVGPRVLRNVILHDEALRCDDCAEAFTSEHDGEWTAHGWVCTTCASYYGRA